MDNAPKQPTKIVMYDGAQQERKRRKKGPWISVIPRIGYGWTYWTKMHDGPNKGWYEQHHTMTPVVYHDRESGVVVTEDTVYVRG